MLIGVLIQIYFFLQVGSGGKWVPSTPWKDKMILEGVKFLFFLLACLSLWILGYCSFIILDPSLQLDKQKSHQFPKEKSHRFELKMHTFREDMEENPHRYEENV